MAEMKLTITSDLAISVRVQDPEGRYWTFGGLVGDLAAPEDGGESMPVLFLFGRAEIKSVSVGPINTDG